MGESTPLANERSSSWGHFLTFTQSFLLECESEHTGLAAIASPSKVLCGSLTRPTGTAGSQKVDSFSQGQPVLESPSTLDFDLIKSQSFLHVDFTVVLWVRQKVKLAT